MSTKILVVDDDLNICDLLKIYFENEGYEVKIVDYKDRHTVTIEIQDEYKYKTVTTMQNIRKGQIKNPYKREDAG